MVIKEQTRPTKTVTTASQSTEHKNETISTTPTTRETSSKITEASTKYNNKAYLDAWSKFKEKQEYAI